MKNKVHVKSGDTVVVLSGKAKGKRGKVIAVSPDESKVIVEGVKLVSKHVKPRKAGQAGGILKAESAMHACKVAIYCRKCGKGTRIAKKIMPSGEKLRVCVRCGEEF